MEVNSEMEGNVVLEMRNIHKSFPGVRALQAVDFTLRKGEIHALMGENGAGSPTLSTPMMAMRRPSRSIHPRMHRNWVSVPYIRRSRSVPI